MAVGRSRGTTSWCGESPREVLSGRRGGHFTPVAFGVGGLGTVVRCVSLRLRLRGEELRDEEARRDPVSRSIFHRAQCAWQLGIRGGGGGGSAVADGVFESGEPKFGGPEDSDGADRR